MLGKVLWPIAVPLTKEERKRVSVEGGNITSADYRFEKRTSCMVLGKKMKVRCSQCFGMNDEMT